MSGIQRLPEEGYLRLWQIVGNPKADPPVPPVIPVSPSTWWAGVKSGHFPKPVKLGPRITAWKVEDIRALVERVAAGIPSGE
ncbi:MAG: helix-turn-helix transcriptional regulator [Gammaproteobacteria bacterium]